MRPRRAGTLGVYRPEARRQHELWLLDLLRVFRRRHEPAGTPQARPGSVLGRARVGVGVAGQSASAVQPRLGRSRRQAMVGAQAVRLVGRAEGCLGRRRRPRLPVDKRPDYKPPEGAKAEKAISGNHPFIMQADGRGWLFAPAGLVDGPMPTHYEPHESPFANPLYAQRSNPARQIFDRPGNRSQPVDGESGADRYPYVMTKLPADGAPHGRRDESHRAPPGRAATGDVLRGQPRTGNRTRAHAPRLGHHLDRARRDRGQGDGDQSACGP